MEKIVSKIKINKFPEKQALAEIYQSKTVKLSFLRKTAEDTYIECNAPAQCRDFLHDIVFAAQTKIDYAIYGMSYDSKAHPLDLDVTRICIKMPDRKSAEAFLAHVPYLHAIEASNDLELSRVVPVEDLVIFIEGSKFWQSSSVLVSLYTFLLRIMAYDVGDSDDVAKGVFEKNPDTIDGQYLTKIGLATFSKVLINLKALAFDSFHGWENTDKMHNYSGIVTYFTANHNGLGATFQDNKNYKQLKASGIL